MPLKSRTADGAVKNSAPVQSVKRAAANPEPDPRKDTLQEQEEAEEQLEADEEEQVSEGMGDDEGDEEEAPVEETHPDSTVPLSNSLGTPVKTGEGESTKPKRQYNRKTVATPVTADGEFDMDTAKARVSEIERAVKAIRSDTTAEIKSIEAEANAKLKELRTEYDALSAKIAEAKFTL